MKLNKTLGRWGAMALLLATGIAPAQAEVTASSATGFAIHVEADLRQAPASAYADLLQVGQWWHPDHTWFGDAGGLSIDPVAMGCFCERAGDRQAMHMQVSYVDPGKVLKMIGGLGPLQMMGVHGGMSWQFKPAPQGPGSRLVFDYQVTGFADQGLDKLAPIVDGVLKLQIQRFQAYSDKTPLPE